MLTDRQGWEEGQDRVSIVQSWNLFSNLDMTLTAHGLIRKPSEIHSASPIHL